jgi:hypothetical protein
LLAFWKIHILHHAAEHGVYGHWMLEELQHHGYRLSPGTLYPMLARMAERGWLRASDTKRSKDARIVPADAPGTRGARADPGSARRTVSRGRAASATKVTTNVVDDCR